MQEQARRLARVFALLTLGSIALVSAVMPFLMPEFRARWFDFPLILPALPVPVLVVFLAWRLFRALDESGEAAQARTEPAPPGRVMWRDGLPFFCALGLFFLSYTGLGISMWPLIVPPEITIWDAAAGKVLQQKQVMEASSDHYAPKDPGQKVRKLISLTINNALVEIMRDTQQTVAAARRKAG